MYDCCFFPPVLHMSVRRQRKKKRQPPPPLFLPRSSCLISFILIIRLIFHSDGLHFWGDYKNVCFLGNASSTEADDLLAGWRANLNSASSSPFSFFFPSCRLCVMAFHINHPPWLLTPCRKSWPSGLRLELWGCILSPLFIFSLHPQQS